MRERIARGVVMRPDAAVSAVAALELFNTLSGKVERLEPAGAPALRMYACGPTIYDYGHIGNFRQWRMRPIPYPACFLSNWASPSWHRYPMISDIHPGIWHALTRFRPGVVVVHGFATVTCLLAILWALCHHVPFLLRGDSNVLDEARPSRKQNGFRSRYLRWLVRHAAAFPSIGELETAGFDAVRRQPQEILFVPYGVDTDYFREQAEPWRARRTEIRSENGWNHDYLLLYVGRLVRQKRVDVLIEAMRGLEEARKDIALLIVGEGVEHQQLADQAKGLRNVYFLGFKDRPDLPQY